VKQLPRLPFIFHTHTGSPTGYAETAAAIMRALWDAGTEVHYIFVGDDVLYEQTSMDHFVDGMRSIEPERGMPEVVYSTAPMFWHNGSDYKVGWTMMEVDGISDQWVRACNSQNEIWVPTPSQVDYFKDSGVEVPIYVAPVGYDSSRYHPNLPPAVYHQDAKFRFFAMGWWQLRKRWDILLEAFDEEFGGDKDVGLIIKTMSNEPDDEIAAKACGYLDRGHRDQVAVVAGSLPWWEVAMIMKACHAFVLPTSGEGWGCPPLQALAIGMPVIITDCLGPGETLRDNKGEPYPGVMLLPAEKEPTKVTHPYYAGKNWWVVDKDNLKRAMRSMVDNYEAWNKAADKGAVMVAKERDHRAAAQYVRKHLARIYKEGMQ